MSRTAIVVPCYNEGNRFDGPAFDLALGDIPDLELVFVNDGSDDDTLIVLRAFEEKHPGRVRVIDLERNLGKSHAVRAGMLEALAGGATYCGYWDADLATPLDEIPRFVETLDGHPDLEVLFGSRVQLLGRIIERKASRHYLGRVGATAISLVLGLAIYDTQCGAKLFRASGDCKALFAEPFHSRWLFDVEIIARMMHARRGSGLPGPAEVIREIPLWEWHDVEGSKVGLLDFFRSMLELLHIRRLYLRVS